MHIGLAVTKTYASANRVLHFNHAVSELRIATDNIEIAGISHVVAVDVQPPTPAAMKLTVATVIVTGS